MDNINYNEYIHSIEERLRDESLTGKILILQRLKAAPQNIDRSKSLWYDQKKSQLKQMLQERDQLLR